MPPPAMRVVDSRAAHVRHHQRPRSEPGHEAVSSTPTSWYSAPEAPGNAAAGPSRATMPADRPLPASAPVPQPLRQRGGQDGADPPPPRPPAASSGERSRARAPEPPQVPPSRPAKTTAATPPPRHLVAVRHGRRCCATAAAPARVRLGSARQSVVRVQSSGRTAGFTVWLPRSRSGEPRGERYPRRARERRGSEPNSR